MATQLDLPLLAEGGPVHVQAEPCEHGGWDVTLAPQNGTAAMHIHCRNWQQVERFRLRLAARQGTGQPARREVAKTTVAAALIIGLLSLGQASGLTLPAKSCPPGSVATISYRLEAQTGGALPRRFSDEQIAVLEKLNRADRDHLPLLPELVVPDTWVLQEELYSPLPGDYPCARGKPKLLVVYLPGQLFGAYEFGRLVRWGPVSSGARRSPTPNGLYTLNWKATGHASSVDPDWFMPWYFNFGNRDGLAFHEYALPGHPASHGCIRLLQRDAQWLFGWGDEWVLDARRTGVVETGTPVFVVGAYNYDAAPPWRSLDWLARRVDLPVLPIDEDANRPR